MNKENKLPINGNLSTISIVSILIAGLSAAAAIAGNMNRDLFYPTAELAEAFVPNDVVILFIGLPILLGSMWATQRGRLLGLLFWPGALFFGVYNSIAYLYALPYSWVSLMHLAMVVLGVYGLIALTAQIDGEVIRENLRGSVHERISGGVLTGFGILFILRALIVLAGALTNGETMTRTELAPNLSDALMSPALIVAGIELWRHKKLGYVGGLGLLFQASMLFVGLIAFMILQPMLTEATFAAMDVVVVFLMGLVCFVPFGMFVRGVRSKSSIHNMSGSQRMSGVQKTSGA